MVQYGPRAICLRECNGKSVIRNIEVKFGEAAVYFEGSVPSELYQPFLTGFPSPDELQCLLANWKYVKVEKKWVPVAKTLSHVSLSSSKFAVT